MQVDLSQYVEASLQLTMVANVPQAAVPADPSRVVVAVTHSDPSTSSILHIDFQTAGGPGFRQNIVNGVTAHYKLSDWGLMVTDAVTLTSITNTNVWVYTLSYR